MIVAIHDANILIDIVKLDLADALFELSFEMRTTDAVWVEVSVEQRRVLQHYVDEGLLGIEFFSSEEVLDIVEYSRNYNGLSFQDCSLLVAARRIHALIITGDKKLRTVIVQEQLEVHGMLWLFDRLVENQILIPSVAVDKLQQLRLLNVRLPEAEIYQRISRWR